MDWLDIMVAQEHQKDLVRRAERDAAAARWAVSRKGAAPASGSPGWRRIAGWLGRRRQQAGRQPEASCADSGR